MTVEILDTISYPPTVGRFNDQQLASRATWTGVPDEDNVTAALHVVNMERQNGSTITTVNPMDPGNATTVGDWVNIPSGDSTKVMPAGRYC